MDRPGDPAVPIIAGQQYQYLLRALTAYRNGERTGEQAAAMTQIAKGLAFGDLPVAAEFYANLRSVRW
jgi:cytochrome c553